VDRGVSELVLVEIIEQKLLAAIDHFDLGYELVSEELHLLVRC
jgi:hypothetical protein